MNLRKSLIKWAKRIERAWLKVDLSNSVVELPAGWYVTEFLIQGVLKHTPRLVVETTSTKKTERKLSGSHSGTNRMLIHLPAGRLIAYSDSLQIDLLAHVPAWEGRARVLLICFRYLLDFFSLPVLLRMIAMQFKKPAELSTELLFFYAPPEDEEIGYLRSIRAWQRYRPYRKILAWLTRSIKIAVVIEEEQQREALNDLLLAPDAVLLASENMRLPANIAYVIPLARTERLRFPAILMLKRAIKKASLKPRLIYTDHDYGVDESSGEKLRPPVFKPQPSAAYLHCFNYIGSSLVLSAELVGSTNLADLLQVETQYRLALQAFADTTKVMHVDEVLFCSEQTSEMATPLPASDSQWPNVAWQRQGSYNILLADAAWQDKPTVDLIIPTRDGLAVLKPCIESILALTDYPNYKIIIVDNGSELAETKEFLAKVSLDPRVCVVDYPGEFNYSAINNYAIAQGDSDYVALVNNDIEVIHADWLTQMMVWATQPEVGIVGAKLLFGNGLVQHAGVTIGMGNAAGHIHRLEQGDSPGYQYRCLATQNMMAVTAACLVTPRQLFEQLAGLDAKYFKVAYNDIDFCLRVEKLGLHVIWTPQARLFHHESVSRGDDMSEQHIERYFYELGILQDRWKTKGFVDKYYSKHLRITDEGVYPQIVTMGKDKLHYLT